MTTTPPEHGSPVQKPETPPPEVLREPSAPQKPNIHVAAFIVWLTIFPLVAIASVVLGPLMADWHPLLRAFVTTLVVVPIAAYWLMPQMFRWYAALERRWAARTAAKHVP